MMNKRYVTIAVATLLAGALLLSLSQRAQATPANISGSFAGGISNLNGDGDTLSTENGGTNGRSNFTENDPNPQTTLTGSFSESLSLGSSYGTDEFFDISIPRQRRPIVRQPRPDCVQHRQ
jgi:hypothetical protein